METATVPRPRGRPRKYRRALADEVCRRLGAGETLRAICRDDGMPPASTVRQWVLDDVEGFAAQYAKARRLQHEHWADEIVEIADDGRGDWVLTEDGKERVNTEAINRSRLRVDTRKWLLSKLHPTEYGDRQTHELTGAGGAPLAVTVYLPENHR